MVCAMVIQEVLDVIRSCIMHIFKVYGVTVAEDVIGCEPRTFTGYVVNWTFWLMGDSVNVDGSEL